MRMDRQQQDTHQPGCERQKLIHIATCEFGHCSGMALFFKFHHGHKEALPICWSSVKLLITCRRIPKWVWGSSRHTACGSLTSTPLVAALLFVSIELIFNIMSSWFDILGGWKAAQKRDLRALISDVPWLTLKTFYGFFSRLSFDL